MPSLLNSNSNFSFALLLDVFGRYRRASHKQIYYSFENHNCRSTALLFTADCLRLSSREIVPSAILPSPDVATDQSPASNSAKFAFTSTAQCPLIRFRMKAPKSPYFCPSVNSSLLAKYVLPATCGTCELHETSIPSSSIAPSCPCFRSLVQAAR